MQRITRRIKPGRLLCAALGALWMLSGCGGGPSISDMPRHEQADEFLEMQARLKGRQASEQKVYPYTERNEAVFSALQQQQRIADARVRQRARENEALLSRAREYDQDGWQEMQRRMERNEAEAAVRNQTREGNRARGREASGNRYRDYERRLEQLAQRQEEMARERELAAYRNQQRIDARVQELRRRQALPGPGENPAAQTAPQAGAAGDGSGSAENDAQPAASDSP